MFVFVRSKSSLDKAAFWQPQNLSTKVYDYPNFNQWCPQELPMIDICCILITAEQVLNTRVSVFISLKHCTGFLQWSIPLLPCVWMHPYMFRYRPVRDHGVLALTGMNIVGKEIISLHCVWHLLLPSDESLCSFAIPDPCIPWQLMNLSKSPQESLDFNAFCFVFASFVWQDSVATGVSPDDLVQVLYL